MLECAKHKALTLKILGQPAKVLGRPGSKTSAQLGRFRAARLAPPSALHFRYDPARDVPLVPPAAIAHHQGRVEHFPGRVVGGSWDDG